MRSFLVTMVLMGAMTVGVTAPQEAEAMWHFGNPEMPTHCAYMDMTDAEVSTDDVGDWFDGSTDYPMSRVYTQCDKPWVEIHFGPDINSHPYWYRRRIFIVTNEELPGTYDEAFCVTYYDLDDDGGYSVFDADDDPLFAFEVFAAL